jgi:hypothetical protein
MKRIVRIDFDFFFVMGAIACIRGRWVIQTGVATEGEYPFLIIVYTGTYAKSASVLLHQKIASIHLRYAIVGRCSAECVAERWKGQSLDPRTD